VVGRHKANFTLKTTLISDESILPKLNSIVLVRGGPGIGKTTLLRRTAMQLLRKDRRAFFFNCAALRPEDNDKSMGYLVRKLATKGTPTDWRFKDSVLLVDGLDETPFDLTGHLHEINGKFASVIVSVRSAFTARFGPGATSLELVPFSPAERTLFFKKWFRDEPEKLRVIWELIGEHKDIREHTRVPLVATLVAALVENDLKPTSKLEIYTQRLRLLLGDWDKVKGVRRMEISPSVKLRYLKHLASTVHRGPRRRLFTRQEMIESCQQYLGRLGEQLGFEKLFNELVIASGVVVEEQPSYFSFGHLSFQEYLVGEYLADVNNPRDLVQLLGHDWWHEPLIFYAVRKGDITELIAASQQQDTHWEHWRQLLQLAAVAPFTSAGSVAVMQQTAGWMRKSAEGEQREIKKELKAKSHYEN
jgi:hypothetical protein